MLISNSSFLFLATAAFVAYVIGALPIGQMISAKVRVCCFTGANFPRASSLSKVLADQVKGFLVVYLICVYVAKDAAQVAAVAVYLGHVHPFVKSWRGRNGVGTLLGAVTALEPIIGLVSIAAWLFTYFVFRLATLALLMATVPPVMVAAVIAPNESLFTLSVLAILQLWQNRNRLMRLAMDEEEMVDWSRSSPEDTGDKDVASDAPVGDHGLVDGRLNSVS